MNADRFYSGVCKTSTCWLWLGAKNKDGYGKLGIGSRDNQQHWLAHRYAYVLAFGAFPKDKSVLHKCDTPACVRPDHLFLGTHQDNMNDMAKKGRAAWRGKHNPHAPVGEAHGMSRLTRDQVVAMKAEHQAGVTQRALAAKYQVSFQHVSDIMKGRRWRHVSST